MSLHFSTKEFDQRKSKVIYEMKRQNIDALLMFRQESMYWLTGYDTFGYVFFKAIQRKISWSVALPFAINLIANLSFTPLLFGARSLILASVDIIVVLATIIWGMTLIWRHHRWVAIAQVPYLIWVTIATCLQLAITQMNDFAV